MVFDIQRVGPSTGLPTRTAQGDILTVATLSHGDTKHIMLIPASVDECYTMAMEAFDLAERFQTLVFVMSDLDLGMNTWMSDPFVYPDKPLDRGKLLDAATLQRLGEWGRYADVDGDGIPYRTIPGDGMPAYFTRGSGHNEKGQYSERPDDYVHNMERLARKFETARQHVPQPEVVDLQDAEIGIIGYGTSRLGDRREPGPARAGDRHQDRVLPAPRVSVHRRSRRLHRPLRADLRRRAEPRCADAEPDAPRAERGPHRQAAEGRPLQRPADRRAIDHRRDPGAGRQEGE